MSEEKLRDDVKKATRLLNQIPDTFSFRQERKNARNRLIDAQFTLDKFLKEPDYPGKNFKWSSDSENRLIFLLKSCKAQEVSEILNKEFPQVNKLTKSAVIGKHFRLRKN